MEFLADPKIWLGLLTLTALEIVLGIDNIIFISILSGKLPPGEQGKARKLGLAGAFVTRVLLLLSISWIARLTTPLFTVGALDFIEREAREITGRDLILIFGGLFLIAKATYEIHHKLEGEEDQKDADGKPRTSRGLAAVVAQIMVVDIVFSLDSVITAVGMVDQVSVMIAAVTVAILVMLFSAEAVAGVVNRHPTLKMLALSFLLLIGLSLLLEGFDQHVPKGYIYFAMGFSVLVEILNIRVRRRREARSDPVRLHSRYSSEEPRPAPDAGPPPP